MPFSAYMEKALLDWSMGGATPTQPVGRFIGFATGTPTTAGASEGPLLRETATFQTASSGVSASASLKAALTCTATAACTPNCWLLWDATSNGNLLAWGTLTATQTLLSADAIAFTAANLKITLA